ncbi:MAG: DUF3810 domain-containing protein [Ruminococcus sp.]|nr:DUF3810 domain-containing protein [Ruminococcus sp.]
MTRKRVFAVSLGVLLFINIAVRAFFRLSPAACESYARYIHPAVVSVFSPITSVFPFSVIEFLIYAAILAVIIITAVLIVKKNRSGLRFFAKALLITLLTLGAVFLFNSEINYMRLPFSYYADIEVAPYDETDILETIKYLSKKVETLEPQTDENGVFVLSGDTLINRDSRAAMENLAADYPILTAFYPNPKPIFGSRMWLSTGLITGVYSPFTLEANYNDDSPAPDLPHTVCHELSHLTGFMREDEANFIAYLACIKSDNPDFVYSGCFSGLTHLVNSYHKSVDSETYGEMYAALPEQVKRDFAADNEYWEPFREKPRQKIADTANDTYLKVNGQADGVMSYGRCVDLIVNEARERGYSG